MTRHLAPSDRYRGDVLTNPRRVRSTPTTVEKDMVLEDPSSGFVGAVVRWANGLVVLEDRHGRKRSFPMGPGLWLEGKPVDLRAAPKRPTPRALTHTASGSRRTPDPRRARVALPSRIYVEGRHDAELVEKIWGDDLRHVGVVVEHLGGIDDLAGIVAEFQPTRGRRLGVLVDHLIAGSKESRIAQTVTQGPHAEYVFVTGHRFIDIWAAVLPQRVGLAAWPDIPRGTDWKTGICRHLGLPARDQKDIAQAWRAILGRVDSWEHLDRRLVTEVEKLIDFVTQDETPR